MVHLHCRSSYSLLQGTLGIPLMMSLAKKKQIDVLCLSDYHNMHGAMEFYHACLKNNIKPLFGLEVLVQLEENDVLLVNIIAKNMEGYHELLLLATLLQTSHLEGIPLMELRDKTVHCCVIVLHGGTYEKHVIQAKWPEVERILKAIKEATQESYVGLVHQESPLWANRNSELRQIAKRLFIKTVAVSRILYELEEDDSLLQVLRALKQGVSLKSIGTSGEKGRFFRSKQEMEQLYLPQDLEQTIELAKHCTVHLPKPSLDLPKYATPKGVSSSYFLRQLCSKGLQKRFEQGIQEEYPKRLEYELTIIEQMKFEDYFLVVWDYVRYAKSIGIQVGAGRGSAAGSLVSYVLGITHVDPLAYGLLFERFLNPERITMPDIDIDFPDTRRDEVIAYVLEKYGKDHVSRILTFGTLKAKQVIRDVGRVLEVPSYDLDMISKKIPNSLGITLASAYATTPGFKQMVDAKPLSKQLYEIALRLEGLPRHVSTHAAGIVVAHSSLVSRVPLMSLEPGMYTTQYAMEYLEELGLLKMDFLGLRNLSIIDRILEDVKHTYHDEVDIMRLPLDDMPTLALLRKVDTVGIFQLESDGMKSLLRKIEPVCFEDIVLTIALFRPGPMENIPEYLKRRQENVRISLHPSLDQLLQPTYGIMIYQEQIMQVAQVMASFSLGKADLLRRAMSKKQERALLALKEEFIVGARNNGYHDVLIEEVYALIMKFANYGFNKSHSVAYGMIAYQMAYLKANYPLAFFRALLNSVIGSESKTYEYMEEARRIGIVMEYPSVNQSSKEYRIEENSLRFPLQVIKNVGVGAMVELLNEREERGVFQDFFDFVARVNSRKVNRKIIESLIDGGALDEFRVSRMGMLQTLDDALKFADLVKIEDAVQTRLDFSLVSKPTIRSYVEELSVKSEREKNVLGFYLGMHPVKLLKDKKGITTNLAQLKQKRGEVTFLAQVQTIKTHRTKSGEMMAFVGVIDEVDAIDIVLMPKLFARTSFLVKGDYVYVQGKLAERDSVLVQKIATMNEKEK